MIGYLQAYFQPTAVEPGYSLAIQVGGQRREGAPRAARRAAALPSSRRRLQ